MEPIQILLVALTLATVAKSWLDTCNYLLNDNGEA